MEKGRVNAVLGLQYGDEGKGRVVDFLAEEHDIVARFNGGPNAGHTIVKGNQEFKIHQIPSGILSPNVFNIIGNGGYLNPVLLGQEIQELREKGIEISPDNLVVSNLAHLILPHHIELDELRESSKKKQGSTKKGIAYAASDKYLREGSRADIINSPDKLLDLVIEGLREANRIRKAMRKAQIFDLKELSDKWLEQSLWLQEYLGNTVDILHTRLNQGQNVLAEGAQSIGLDIELGPYPYGSSSHAGVGGILTGLSINHSQIGQITGVIKAVKSKVGNAPFVTEIDEQQEPELVARIRGAEDEIDSERGTTTGRLRDVGYIDLPEIRSAIRTSGIDNLALTKLDHLKRFGNAVLIATGYRDGLTGEEYRYAPNSEAVLRRCQPIYERLELWNRPSNISNIQSYAKLPSRARHFIQFLEDDLDRPITYIGVGPEREQLLVRN